MSFDQIETADYLTRGHQVKLKVKCGSVGSVEDHLGHLGEKS